MSDFKFSPAPDEPPPSTPKSRGPDYNSIPWLRRSSTNTAFILIHVLTCGFFPLILVTCFVLLTGDVYYSQRDLYGKLKKWSAANKVVAFVILLINAAIWLAVLASLVSGAATQ